MAKVKQVNAEEYLELEDRKILRSALDSHRTIVENAAKEYKSSVAWQRVSEGFKRGKQDE